MQSFKRASVPDEQIKEIEAELSKHYPAEYVAEAMELTKAEEVFINDVYQVSRSRFVAMGDTPMVHLSIRRLDREAVRDWRDVQQIKNELVGAECEGVELFPAESRLVDIANQFHYWFFEDPKIRFPFGFDVRLVSGEVFVPDLPRAKQRERTK